MKRCTTCEFLPCRCEDLAAGRMGNGHTKKCWPMVSEALAVHPSQIKDVMERNKKAGISGVSYTPSGEAIIADRGARRELMRLSGVIDRSGGYGDTYSGQSSTGEHDPPPPKIRPRMPVCVRRGR